MVLLRRLVTWPVAVHPGCVSGEWTEREREERCGGGVCQERSRGGLFEAGPRSVAAIAINAKTACIPPRGLCGAATRRRFTTLPN